VPAINVVVEDNPELKSDKTVTKFMNELTDTADKLMYARRSVIDLSQSYNVKLVTFPSNIVAQIFGFKKEKGLQTPQLGEHISVSADELKSPEVEL
jgi:LemA protein